MEENRAIVTHAHTLAGDSRFIRLRNAFVDSRNWVIYHDGRAIVPWVTHMINIDGAWKNGFKYRSGEAISASGYNELPRISVDMAVLGGGDPNIYHYTIDYLAGTFNSSTSGQDVAALPLIADGRLAWQRELVDCYTAGALAVILAKNDVLFEVRDLCLPRKCFDFQGRHLESEWAGWARRTTSHIATHKDSPERIYVSRNRARSRGVENEAELEHMLQGLGFATIHPETLSVADQIALFKRVKIAVGPTGAAFTNMAYASPGGILVELMPQDSWMPPQIDYLMQASGIQYSNLKCPGKFQDRVFRVDVAALAAHLRDRGVR